MIVILSDNNSFSAQKVAENIEMQGGEFLFITSNDILDNLSIDFQQDNIMINGVVLDVDKINVVWNSKN